MLDDDDDDDKTQSYHQALLNQDASHIISYPWSEIRYFKFILPAFKKKKGVQMLLSVQQ